MDKLMQDKAIIVTGAGSVGEGWGNGKAAAVLYAREGGRVLAVDRSIEAALETQEIIRREGGVCEVLAADVSRSADVKAIAEAAIRISGGSTSCTTTSVSPKSVARWRPAKKAGTGWWRSTRPACS